MAAAGKAIMSAGSTALKSAASSAMGPGANALMSVVGHTPTASGPPLAPLATNPVAADNAVANNSPVAGSLPKAFGALPNPSLSLGSAPGQTSLGGDFPGVQPGFPSAPMPSLNQRPSPIGPPIGEGLPNNPGNPMPMPGSMHTSLSPPTSTMGGTGGFHLPPQLLASLAMNSGRGGQDAQAAMMAAQQGQAYAPKLSAPQMSPQDIQALLQKLGMKM